MSRLSDIKRRSHTESVVENTEVSVSVKEFTIEEINAVIRSLNTASFPVKDIELLYSAIGKLQAKRELLLQNKS